MFLTFGCLPLSPVGKASAVTPFRKPAESSGRQKVSGEGGGGGGGGGEMGRKKRGDVTTPAAARARASLVNTSYVPEVGNLSSMFAVFKEIHP